MSVYKSMFTLFISISIYPYIYIYLCVHSQTLHEKMPTEPYPVHCELYALMIYLCTSMGVCAFVYKSVFTNIHKISDNYLSPKRNAHLHGRTVDPVPDSFVPPVGAADEERKIVRNFQFC